MDGGQSHGALAMAPRERQGWITYNFEVEGLHTYVADGVRVHNDSTGPSDNFDTGVQPGQYFAETQAFQEQLSGLPASPDAQLQSSDIVAPPWETGAQPVEFVQETLNFQ